MTRESTGTLPRASASHFVAHARRTQLQLAGKESMVIVRELARLNLRNPYSIDFS